MEFYLVDNKPFSLLRGRRSPRVYYAFCDSKLDPIARYFLDTVKPLNGTGAQNEINPTIKLQIICEQEKDPSCWLARGTFQICNGSGDGINVFEMITHSCGEDNVRVNFKLNELSVVVNEGAVDIEEKDRVITNLFDQDGNLCGYGCQTGMMAFRGWSSRSRICGRLTVSIKLTKSTIDSLFLKRFTESTNLFGGSKRLLEDAVCSDLVILASNGTEIKCHKLMLAVRSDVFKAMFETQMKESITSVVEIPDMSEKAVRALLAFIYHWDIKEVLENCDIALELLVAADKYNVQDLFSVVAGLTFVCPNEWFNVNMAVKLLIFTERQREICKKKIMEQLQEKAFRVLKSLMKDSSNVLLNSEVYQRLFRNNPETAMAISARLFSFAFE